MLKRLYQIFSAVIFAFIQITGSFAQGPEVLWTKTFGGADYDFGQCVIQTNDGGFVIAGSTQSSGAGDRDAWMIRTDSTGNALWSKTIGGLKMDEAYSIWQNSDGGFIVAGQIRSIPADSVDILYFRTDSAGNLLWLKTYGGPGFQLGTSVRQTSAGGFIVAGYTIIDSAFHSDAFLLLTDSLGNELQFKTFDRGDYDYAQSVVQTASGGYSFCGRTSQSNLAYNAWFVSTDPSLNLLNDKVYGDSSSEYGQSLKQTADGGYIIAGTTYSYGYGDPDFWLIRTNSSGDTLWTKNYGGTETELGYSVDLTNDGGFILTGYTSSFGNGNRDVWLIRTDGSGDTLWTKTIGGTSADQGSSVMQLSDGGFIVTGYTASYGSGRSDLWLIRLNSFTSTPVELISFTASAIHNSVKLIWSTATETNNKEFEIERKASGIQSAVNNLWMKIGSVPGSGSTAAPKNYLFEDKDVLPGYYLYRLKQIDFDGTIEYSKEAEVEISAPGKFSLEQNYPNPFNPATNIQYSVGSRQFVSIKVFDIMGNEVTTLINEEKPAGTYKVEFNAANLSSGVYFYKLQAGNLTDTKKFILLK